MQNSFQSGGTMLEAHNSGRAAAGNSLLHAQWYLLMAVIYISWWQMIRDEHFLLCLLAIYVFSFVKCAFTSFACFCLFVGCVVCLFIIELQDFFSPAMGPLSDISAMNIFSQFVACLFSWQHFLVNRSFKFRWDPLINFFRISAFDVLSKKIFADQKIEKIVSYVFF